MANAPGWYRDGVTPDVERWFDGTDWHQLTRPLAATDDGWLAPGATAGPRPVPGEAAGLQPQGAWPVPGRASGVRSQGMWPAPGQVSGYSAPPPGSDPQDPLHWLVPIGRSGQSIASGYLGLVGLLVWPLAPFAVWTGIVALQLASRAGAHGSGRAWFGIVTGVIGTLLGLWALISWLT
jgi:hypothetical protein